MLQWKETNKQTTDQLKPGSLPWWRASSIPWNPRYLGSTGNVN
jgi:hypothetical protein